MKAEIYKDEGFELMGALLQLNSITISVGAEWSSGQPGGPLEISRGLSASDTAGRSSEKEPHPGGVLEAAVRLQRVLSPFFCARFWHPSRVRMIHASRSGGVASLCLAQPPANFCEPFGFVPQYCIQLL